MDEPIEFAPLYPANVVPLDLYRMQRLMRDCEAEIQRLCGLTPEMLREMERPKGG